jgi:HSP20 family protein
MERSYGSFTRSFVLPDTADGEKVDAKLTDGLLKVRIPKRPSAQPRKITVSAS